MECYTYLRNVPQIYYLMGRRPMKDVLGNHLKDLLFYLASLVECHPITAKDQSRIHQFGKKILPGLFLGYVLYTDGISKGDVLIADLEELETIDASEIYSKKLNAKEVIIFETRRIYFFQSQMDEIKTLGGDQELTTTTLVWHRPIQGKSNIDFLGESEGSLLQPHESFPDAGEAINDFWSMSGRLHISPSR